MASGPLRPFGTRVRCRVPAAADFTIVVAGAADTITINSIHTANRLAASASTVSLAMANALAMGGQDLVRASCNSPATGW
jgi:hypothetical protein